MFNLQYRNLIAAYFLCGGLLNV